MATVNEDQLLKLIKAKQFDNLYLIYGSEDFLKQHYANLIAQKAVKPDFSTFNFHSLDGKTATLDEIADCVNALPLMDEYTCTVIHDMPLNTLITDKKKNGEEQSDANDDENPELSGQFETLVELISDLPPSSILIFWQDAIPVDEKNGKWIKIIKTFEKHGTAAKLEKRSQYALAKLLCDSAAKKGCSMEKDVANYLIELAGNDLNELKNELDKLCAYVGGGVITKKTVNDSVIAKLEARIFSLEGFITSGKADEAFNTLDTLLKQREEPVKILAILSGAYIDMYRVKAAVSSGLNTSAVGEAFKGYSGKMEFKLRNAAQAGSRYSLEQLRECLELLADADTKLKSTRTEPGTVLEQLIIGLMRTK